MLMICLTPWLLNFLTHPGFVLFTSLSCSQIVFSWTRCYWGYCFESLATEDPSRADGEGIHHVDSNVEFCSVIKTKLGAHRVLMGAEMDCCDSTDDGRRFYVELKTSREVGMPARLHFLSAFIVYQLIDLFWFFFVTHSWIIILRKDLRGRNCSRSG